MKQVTAIFLLVMFSALISAEENGNDKNLSLVLTSNRRAPRVGQSVNVHLKIAGQAIAEITEDTKNVEPVFSKKPEFVCQFSVQPQKEGDCILGPYKLSFNGVPLESNALTIRVLPEWKGGFGTFFRMDCNQINLGNSFELIMETWSNEQPKAKISALFNPERASIESGITNYRSSIKNNEEKHCLTKSWIITPKSAGEFLITKDFFREFPDNVKPPHLKVQVK